MSIMNPSMNKMVAELVYMPPPQLAQYAEQNKDNTMLFLAAKAASDIQKKQQAASAAKQQQQAAPPVADQVVQQMAQGLPEESGIGALPAPNMTKLAGGGIVAFADRGLVYDPYEYGYQDPGVDAQSALRARAGAQRFTSDSSVDPMQALAAKQAAGITLSMDEQAQLRESQSAPTNYQSGPHARPARVPAPSVATMPTDATRRTDSRFTSEGRALTPVSAPVGQRSAAPTAPSAGTAPVQKAGESSAERFNRIYEAMPGARANLPPEIQEAEDIRTAQAGKELASEKEAATGLAALHGKKEARIGEREKRLADKSSNDVNMALIDAGLAMMQSRGQGLAGIAEGAGVGMKRYAEDTKATEAARQKIEEARDAYDDLKFNREDMSRKQILAAEGKIADAKVATKSANVAEIARRENVNLKTAGHIHDADEAKLLQEQTQRFQAGQNALNRQVQLATANAPGREERVAAILGAGGPQAEKLKKGMEELTAIQSGKFSAPAEYAKYLAEWVKSGGVAGPKMSMAEYAAQFARPKVVDVGAQPLLARPGG